MPTSYPSHLNGVLVTVTLTPEAIILAAAVLAALLALWRGVRALVRKLDAIDSLPAKVAALDSLPAKVAALEELVRRELTHNHGSSIKDDVHGLAVGMGSLGRDLDQLRTDFDTHTRRPRT